MSVKDIKILKIYRGHLYLDRKFKYTKIYKISKPSTHCNTFRVKPRGKFPIWIVLL